MPRLRPNDSPNPKRSYPFIIEQVDQLHPHEQHIVLKHLLDKYGNSDQEKLAIANDKVNARIDDIWAQAGENLKNLEKEYLREKEEDR